MGELKFLLRELWVECLDHKAPPWWTEELFFWAGGVITGYFVFPFCLCNAGFSSPALGPGGIAVSVASPAESGFFVQANEHLPALTSP